MARLICDTGPLFAALDRSDPAYALAASLVTHHGRDLLVPEPVVSEMDYLLRDRIGAEAARLFLESLAHEEHTLVFLTSMLFRRAVEFDEQYADLGLGFVDSSVMACAERFRIPVLTFDFGHFRATRSLDGPWELVVTEDQYRRAVRG